MLGLSQAELIKRLKRLDEDAYLSFEDDVRFQIVIVGGGALVMQGYISRMTYDIDVFSVPPALMSLLEKYGFDCRVQAYANNFPTNYKDRLVLLLTGQRIDYYSMSLEDIIISKLYSMRSTDKADITSDDVIGSLDWNLLERLAQGENEAKASALNEKSYREMLISYKEYVGEFGP